MAVAHDEFRRMGISGVSGFLGAGAAVVDVRGVLMEKRRRGWGFVVRGFDFFG